MNGVEYRHPVHTRSSPTPDSMRLRKRFPHRSSGFHIPIRRASGKRGKTGTRNTSRDLNLQISRFTPPGFGKLTPEETSSIQNTSAVFPLFLPQLRVLLSFLLIFHCFSFPVALPAPSAEFHPQHPIHLLSAAHSFNLRSTAVAHRSRNPDKPLVFHLRMGAPMNTIKREQTIAVSGPPLVVVQCGQPGNTSIRGSSVTAKRGWNHVDRGS